MQQKKLKIGTQTVTYYFDASLSLLRQLVAPRQTILLIDEQVAAAFPQKFRGWQAIVLKSGEAYKVQATVDAVIEQLIRMGADRQTTLVGVGGGVVTDLTGYIASIYMRGINFGFVPTTILALVDAAIGGKNGIDVGVYKNMIGTIRQPRFILHDLSFLKSLPEAEWRGGFAEIIKHACIRDRTMFAELERGDLAHYQKRKAAVASLVQRNALLKTKVVQSDEWERGDRKLLNFGHTLGHALENQYHLRHGEAVAIGMQFAARLSASITGFRHVARVRSLIEQYELPTAIGYDRELVFPLLKTDKKKEDAGIHFILLDRIGKGVIHSLTFDQLYETL